MPLEPGTKLGPYEVLAPLGAGGMGEVYRARDPRLGRDVAIKLLPDAFANDPERLARFEREARLLASLQHANIAVLHGLEESGGRRFLVMECVEGESLAERLKAGALPLAEALEVTRAIATALEAAHEGGIVHRDLKPGNVMVTPAGDVKVLDFGLAKGGAGSSSASTEMSASPTMTYAGTQAGVILGTAAYMSPEQARGKPVDRRTDIWSFGCVLYECLTGSQAFAGETVSDIVARILQTEPDWAALPAGTPARLRALLRRCLEKDAKRRLRDIGEARIEVEDMLAGRTAPEAAAPAAAAPARRAPAWPALAAVAVLAAAAGWGLPQLFERPAVPPPVRFEVAPPPGQRIPDDGASAWLSPDGRMLAFIAADSSGVTHAWIRRLDALAARELPGTDGVVGMFWSPDDRFLAFYAGEDRLMKVAADGGSRPERICATKSARGGTWNRDGVIVLAPYSNGGLYRTTDGGEPLVQLTHPDSAAGVTGHRYPVFLPDGRHFLYSTIPASPDGTVGIRLGSLDGGPDREVMRTMAGVALAEGRWLLSTRNGKLDADGFDPGRRALTGRRVTLPDSPAFTQYVGAPEVSVAADGTLSWVTSALAPMRLAWFDLGGHEVAATPCEPGSYLSVAVTPDGRHALATLQDDSHHYDIVMLDLERGVVSRVSRVDEEPSDPILSPDGSHAAYLENTHQAVRVVSLVDGGVTTLLESDGAYKRLHGWTPDGSEIVYSRLDPVTKWDVWQVAVAGGEPKPLVRTAASESYATISPNGRWLTYQSNGATGANEVYLTSLVSPGRPYQVTVGGGGGGWPRTGDRFYFGEARERDVIREAPVREAGGITLGPSSVFARIPANARTFDISPDGRRILAIVPSGAPRPTTITVLQHWTSAIRKP